MGLSKHIHNILVLFLACSTGLARAACTLSNSVALNQAGTVELRQFLNEEENSFTMEITFTDGKSFVAVGVNENGQASMTPSRAIVGHIDNGSPSVGLYRLANYAGIDFVQDESQQARIVDSSFVQTDTTSTLTFTYLLGSPEGLEINDDTQWLWSVGYANNAGLIGHGARGSFKLPLTDGCSVDDEEGDGGDVEDGDDEDSDTASSGIVLVELKEASRELWMAHGVMMTLAWAVCAPLAIGASVLRVVFDKMGMAKGTWYKIHYYGNVMTTLLTICAFLIAVITKRQQTEEGSESTRTTHGKVGISIFILCVLQSAAARFRPGLPKAPESKEGGASAEKGSAAGKDVEVASAVAKPVTTELPPKSTIRVAWEYGHRVVGITLLGLAWYNCHTGIGLSAVIFEENSDWTGIYWAVVGVIGGLTLVGKVVVR